MIRQGIVDAWDYLTNWCSVQECMDIGQAQRHPTSVRRSTHSGRDIRYIA
jgi:hypothetical protein